MVKIIFVVIATAEAASCSSAEQAAIQKMDAQTFGDASNKCSTSALGLTGINHDKFNSCLGAAVARLVQVWLPHMHCSFSEGFASMHGHPSADCISLLGAHWCVLLRC